MRNNPHLRRFYIYIALILAVLIGITLANAAYARSHPGGTDFLVQWTGVRTFFTQGESPYSSTATLNIQTNLYGHEAQTGEIAYRFTEPLYSMAFYAPFALIGNYEVARGIWMTLLEVCLLGIAYLGLKLPQRRPPLWLFVVSFALVVMSFNGIRPLLSGNDVIIVTLLIMIALYSIVNGHDEIAAVVLAFATIRPLLTLPVLVFVLVWAIIKRRKAILYWFFGALVLLVGFTSLLVPTWLIQNVQAFIQAIPAAAGSSPGAMMVQAWGDIGVRLSVFWSVLIAGILLAEWIGAFRGNERNLLWTGFLTLAMSQWVGIPTNPENFILIIAGILFCFAVLLQRWGNVARTYVFGISAMLLVIPWLIGLTGGSSAVQEANNPVMFFILPFTAIILLYWTKWWTIRSTGNQGLHPLSDDL